MNVMIDIETLGLDIGSSIISIGAVKFDETGLGEELYRNVDLMSCEAVGLEIDAETLDWWLHQPVEVQGQLTDGVTITTALNDLAVFIDEEDEPEIWANSPSFDCEMLEHAYDAVGLDVPWSFYHERDFRTLKELPVTVDVDQDGNEHDALDDARYQARVASEILAVITQGTEAEK